eukprot:2767950-Amphidinium_carterae.2
MRVAGQLWLPGRSFCCVDALGSLNSKVEQLEVSQMRPTEDAWTSATVSVAPLLAGWIPRC